MIFLPVSPASLCRTNNWIHSWDTRFYPTRTRLFGTALFCICHRYDSLFTVFIFTCNCLMNEIYVTGVFFRDVLNCLGCSHFWRLIRMWHNCKHHKKCASFRSAIMKYCLLITGQWLHSVTLNGVQELRKKPSSKTDHIWPERLTSFTYKHKLRRKQGLHQAAAQCCQHKILEKF